MEGDIFVRGSLVYGDYDDLQASRAAFAPCVVLDDSLLISIATTG